MVSAATVRSTASARVSFCRSRLSIFLPTWFLVGCDPEDRGALSILTGDEVGYIDAERVLDCLPKTMVISCKPKLRMSMRWMTWCTSSTSLPR